MFHAHPDNQHHDGHDHGHDKPGHHDHRGHDHGHHHHAPANFGWRFLTAIALNGLFIAAEIVFGFRANSLALLADAGHNVSDVLGLIMAWTAWWLGKKAPGPRFTYGYRGASIMAALLNSVLLLVAVGGIGWEAVQRLTAPATPEGMTVMAVAGGGIVINGVTAWLFAGGGSDLNIRAAFFHLLGDAVVSAAVVVAGFVMLRTHWVWLDPVLSLAVSGVIVWGTWGLLRDAIALSLQGVPRGIDADGVRGYLGGLPGVAGVHDLHIWGMSTTEVAMTAHLVMPQGHPGDEFLHELAGELKAHYGICHATVQVELGDAQACALTPEETV
ncbi:MAG: cation diffusion facilitator family transporter [Asticcacaulis sp.]